MRFSTPFSPPASDTGRSSMPPQPQAWTIIDEEELLCKNKATQVVAFQDLSSSAPDTSPECEIVETPDDQNDASPRQICSMLAKLNLHILLTSIIMFSLPYITFNAVFTNATPKGPAWYNNWREFVYDIVLGFSAYPAVRMVVSCRPVLLLPSMQLLSGLAIIISVTLSNPVLNMLASVLQAFANGVLYVGCIFYVARWYPVRYLAMPFSILIAVYSSISLTLGLATLALENVDIAAMSTGDSLSFVTGLVTLVSSSFTFSYLRDWPEDNGFLTAKQRVMHTNTINKNWPVVAPVRINTYAWKIYFKSLDSINFMSYSCSSIALSFEITPRDYYIAVQNNNAPDLNVQYSMGLQIAQYVIGLILVTAASGISDWTGERVWFLWGSGSVLAGSGAVFSMGYWQSKWMLYFSSVFTWAAACTTIGISLAWCAEQTTRMSDFILVVTLALFLPNAISSILDETGGWDVLLGNSTSVVLLSSGILLTMVLRSLGYLVGSLYDKIKQKISPLFETEASSLPPY